MWRALFQAFEELESLLARNGICIAVKEKLVKDSGVADESVYDSIVQRLLTKRRARGKRHHCAAVGNEGYAWQACLCTKYYYDRKLIAVKLHLRMLDGGLLTVETE